MRQIHTILFDLGNVLAYIDFNAFWRSLGFFQPEEIAPFKVGYKSWTLQYETGYISTLDYLNGLQSVFDKRFAAKQLEKAFASIMLDPIEGMLDIVKRVSDTYQTALVSNTNEIHYQLSLKRYESLQILPKHYLSYQLHAMKPARSFYDTLLRNQESDPSEILFIDDLVENVEGARSVGMQAIRFEGVEKLNASLNAFLD